MRITRAASRRSATDRNFKRLSDPENPSQKIPTPPPSLERAIELPNVSQNPGLPRRRFKRLTDLLSLPQILRRALQISEALLGRFGGFSELSNAPQNLGSALRILGRLSEYSSASQNPLVLRRNFEWLYEPSGALPKIRAPLRTFQCAAESSRGAPYLPALLRRFCGSPNFRTSRRGFPRLVEESGASPKIPEPHRGFLYAAEDSNEILKPSACRPILRRAVLFFCAAPDFSARR